MLNRQVGSKAMRSICTLAALLLSSAAALAQYCPPGQEAEWVPNGRRDAYGGLAGDIICHGSSTDRPPPPPPVNRNYCPSGASCEDPLVCYRDPDTLAEACMTKAESAAAVMREITERAKREREAKQREIEHYNSVIAEGEKRAEERDKEDQKKEHDKKVEEHRQENSSAQEKILADVARREKELKAETEKAEAAIRAKAEAEAQSKAASTTSPNSQFSDKSTWGNSFDKKPAENAKTEPSPRSVAVDPLPKTHTFCQDQACRDAEQGEAKLRADMERRKAEEAARTPPPPPPEPVRPLAPTEAERAKQWDDEVREARQRQAEQGREQAERIKRDTDDAIAAAKAAEKPQEDVEECVLAWCIDKWWTSKAINPATPKEEVEEAIGGRRR